MDRSSISRQALFETADELVDLSQDFLDIEFRVFVLGQANSGFEQREFCVALHQGGKVFQRGGHF